ncbi:ATPase [Caloramator sp. mosi_1]|uniref:ATPase n=1 Tax=Caloramator sp. mosi_1 TaxID=3023090 RepID=UPI00235FDA80|nr:ATPase [Caloramator sp. mosi_1]WDC83990.1 ATPase [Caloramator sp. mosi_1]
MNDKLEAEKEKYFELRGQLQALNSEKEKLEDKLKALENRELTLLESRRLLQNVSEYARDQSKQQIEHIVTNCLQYIFNSNIEFKIELNEKANRNEADFYVITPLENGQNVTTRPEVSRGGGVVDIVSLALRIALLEAHNPKINGPLILDEPAKHVSEDYVINVAEFLKQVSKMFNRQIIMVTHNMHLLESADKKYKVELIDTVSSVTPVT